MAGPRRSPRTRARALLCAAVLAVVAVPAGGASPASAAPVTITGEVGVVHEDLRGRKGSRNRTVLRTAHSAIPLGGRTRVVQQGARMRVHGSLRRGRLHVRSARRVAGRTRVRAAGASGTRSTAVVMFNWQNDQRTPFTAASVRSTMFTGAASTDAYFREQSFENLSLGGLRDPEGDVFGWYTIPDGSGRCDPFGWANAAREAAAADGVNLGLYDHVVYVFPNFGSCGWSGLAFMPGRESWLNGQPSLYVSGHELGHNLSLNHANARHCTSGGTSVAISATCTDREYGDPFDIMGRGYSRHVSNFHKRKLGWFGDAQTRTVTAAGTYTIEPAETFGPALARIPLARAAGQDAAYYWLEYRRPFGTWFDNFSSSSPAVNGLSIRRANEPSSTRAPVLIDTHPNTPGNFSDAPLAAGETFTDPAQGLSITVGTATALGITFDVAFDTPPDMTAPTAPALTAAPAAGPAIKLDWSDPPAGDGVAAYRVMAAYPAGSKLYTVATLPATARTYTDTSVYPNWEYGYVVVAYDAFGNPAASTRQVVRAPLAPDTQAPLTPVVLTASVSGTTVSLSWPPAWDNRGVARYLLTRGDEPVATVPHESWRGSYTRVDTAVAPGEHTYAVVAEDAAGNRSAPRTVLATVAEPDATPPPPDTTLPQISAGLRRSRRHLSVSAAATDASGIDRMWVAQGARVLARSSSSSLRADIPLSRLSGGTIDVWAADGAGNLARRRMSVPRP